MGELRYEFPETLDAAVALLAGESGAARVIAGGTDVLVQLRADTIDPGLMVGINNIPEVRTIAAENGGFRIGAAVTGMELLEHTAFAKTWPGVIDSVNLIGSVQIRNRATVGGNFCNASPSADSVPAMFAANAVATIVGPKGRREVPVEDIATGPGQTSLAKDEILTSFFLPERPPHAGDAYLRFTPRTEMDIAVAGASVCLALDGGGSCTAARVAIAAVAERVLLVDEAAKALVGTPVDDGALEDLAVAVRAACRPIDDKRGTKTYRIKVTGVLAMRAAKIALARARKR